MEYFSPFPLITRDSQQLTNITARANILKDIKTNLSMYQNYLVGDNERPEDVAYKFYGDANLFWVILLCNDIDDPYYDWVLNDTELNEYLVDKYGSLNAVYAVKWYVTTAGSTLGAGVVVNFGTPFSTPVTNYDYETQLNEERRKIKILKGTYISQLLSEIKNIY